MESYVKFPVLVSLGTPDVSIYNESILSFSYLVTCQSDALKPIACTRAKILNLIVFGIVSIQSG